MSDTERTPDHVRSVVANAIGWAMYADGPDGEEPSVELNELEQSRVEEAATRVLAHLAELSPVERVVMYRDGLGEWRGRAVAGNNRILFPTGEGYKNQQDCADVLRRSFGLEPEIIEV